MSIYILESTFPRSKIIASQVCEIYWTRGHRIGDRKIIAKHNFFRRMWNKINGVEHEKVWVSTYCHKISWYSARVIIKMINDEKYEITSFSNKKAEKDFNTVSNELQNAIEHV